MKCICDKCKKEVHILDSFCLDCGSALEPLDFESGMFDAGLSVTDIKPVGNEVSLNINGRVYTYLQGKAKSGKLKGKNLKAAEIVEHMKVLIKKAGIGKALAWVKSNFELSTGSKVKKGKNDESAYNDEIIFTIGVENEKKRQEINTVNDDLSSMPNIFKHL